MTTSHSRLLGTKYQLDKIDAGHRARLLAHCTAEQKERLENLPEMKDISSLFYPSKVFLLDIVDLSWYEKAFTPYPEQDQKYLLSQITEPKEKKNPLLFRFALDMALNYLKKTENLPLPTAMLKKQGLSFLVDLPKKSLMRLSRFLGLYDVSLEIQKLVQRHQIQGIEQAFTGNELLFLREIQKDKHPISFIPIGLARWDGNIDHLNKIILLRGINRLSKALWGAIPSLLWYVIHKFPKMQGAAFRRFHKKLENKSHIDILINQVQSTWEYLDREE